MISASDFWMLDAAVEMGIDLPVLVSPQIELALNRRSHGLTRPALVEAVASLFARGLIRGQRDNEPVALDAEAVETGLSGPGPRFGGATYYFLTAAGGVAWEVLARPDWSLFFGDSGGADGTRSVEATTIEFARSRFLDPSSGYLSEGRTQVEQRLAPCGCHLLEAPTGRLSHYRRGQQSPGEAPGPFRGRGPTLVLDPNL